MRFDFSKIRYDHPLGKLIRLPLRLLPKNLIVPVFQGKLRGMKWIIGASTHGCWLGSAEFEKQQFLESIVTEGSTFYDIGGHVGLYTLLASKLVGETGRVFVFEPFPGNIKFLKRHIVLNGLSNVTLFESAVSDTEGTVFFKKGRDSSEGRIAEDGELSVSTVTLDKMFELSQITPPDFIKIDVEGAEFMVLRGAREIIHKYHPTVLLATHGEQLARDCAAFLLEMGYSVKPLKLKSWQEQDEFVAEYLGT